MRAAEMQREYVGEIARSVEQVKRLGVCAGASNREGSKGRTRSVCGRVKIGLEKDRGTRVAWRSHLALLQLGHLLCLLARLRLDAKQAPQQEETDLDREVDLWETPNRPEHLANETICATQRGVDDRAHTDEATRHGVLQLVLLRVQ
jgi:hypothetical protein